jgi:hypothetical protein
MMFIEYFQKIFKTIEYHSQIMNTILGINKMFR